MYHIRIIHETGKQHTWDAQMLCRVAGIGKKFTKTRHLPNCIDFRSSQPRGDGSWVSCDAPAEVKTAAFTAFPADA